MHHLDKFNTQLVPDPRQFSVSNTQGGPEGRTSTRRLLRRRETHGSARQTAGTARSCKTAAGFFHWLITVAVPCAACKGRGQKEIKHPARKRQTISAGFCKRPQPFKKTKNKTHIVMLSWQLARNAGKLHMKCGHRHTIESVSMLAFVVLMLGRPAKHNYYQANPDVR